MRNTMFVVLLALGCTGPTDQSAPTSNQATGLAGLIARAQQAATQPQAVPPTAPAPAQPAQPEMMPAQPEMMPAQPEMMPAPPTEAMPAEPALPMPAEPAAPMPAQPAQPLPSELLPSEPMPAEPMPAEPMPAEPMPPLPAMPAQPAPTQPAQPATGEGPDVCEAICDRIASCQLAAKEVCMPACAPHASEIPPAQRSQVVAAMSIAPCEDMAQIFANAAKQQPGAAQPSQPQAGMLPSDPDDEGDRE